MTRHGKLLTSTGGLIILPEEEFNKVRCKPRPVRSSRSGDAAVATTPVASSSKTNSGDVAVKSSAEPKAKGSKAKAEADASGNFEQQRQEDLIRLLYQRLTSPNEHSSAESSGGESRSGSPIPDDTLVVTSTTEVQDEQIQVMEVEHQIVVESPEVAAAVVVESIPNSEDQVFRL